MSLETVKFALEAFGGLVAVWFVVTRLIRFLAWVERSEIARQQAEAQGKAVAAPVAAAARKTIPPHHVAAIAAAVAACGYRVVHIADTKTGQAWAADGRRRQQTSHRPH